MKPSCEEKGLKPVNKNIALCLSGRGIRASLFHLGTLLRLNDLRIFTRADKITSVISGNVLAVHLERVIGEMKVQDGACSAL